MYLWLLKIKAYELIWLYGQLDLKIISVGEGNLQNNVDSDILRCTFAATGEESDIKRS